MTKGATAGLIAHIDDEVTTLTSLWRVTRRDGEVFTFTDHDRDIKVDLEDFTNPCPTNELTYSANSGITRTVIQNTANLSVDNVDVSSIIDPEGLFVTEQDVRARKWDFAKVELFIINHQAKTQGPLKMRTGFLGEVNLGKEVFFAELRGLVQLLQHSIVEVYSPQCRADLGDSRCSNDTLEDGVQLASITETTEVDSGVSADNDAFVVPDHHIGRKDLILAADWRYLQGMKIDASVDPSLGKLTLLRIASTEDGTPNNPYILTTGQDVQDMNLDDLAWYALLANIDMTAFGLFTPIQRPGGGDWRGGLDGRGFAIQNLDLDHSGVPIRCGLFDDLNASARVRRLVIDAATARANGSLFCAPLAARCDGLVEDCIAINGTVTTDGDFAGGMFGALDTASVVRRCFAVVLISGTVGADVGGFAGATGATSNHKLLSFDSTVATTSALGSGTPTNVARTTAQMQDPTNFPEDLTGLSTGDFDMIALWAQAVASTSRPALRTLF